MHGAETLTDLISPFLFLTVAGGAGLLGGVLLAEGFQHHEHERHERHERRERREEEAAYDQGQSGFVVSNLLRTVRRI